MSIVIEYEHEVVSYKGKGYDLYSEWHVVTPGFKGDRHEPGYDPEVEAHEFRLYDVKGNEVTNPEVIAVIYRHAEADAVEKANQGDE